MKTDIHPQYQTIKVTCACGNIIEMGTTIKELRVDVCSACHPFYTGTQKFVDTAGRVDKFKKKMETAEALRKAKNTKSADIKDSKSADTADTKTDSADKESEPVESRPEDDQPLAEKDETEKSVVNESTEPEAEPEIKESEEKNS